MTDKERIDHIEQDLDRRLSRIESAIDEIRVALGALAATDPHAAEREANRAHVPIVQRVHTLAAIKAAPAGKTMAELRRAFPRLPEQYVHQAVNALMAAGNIRLVDTNAGRRKSAGGRIRARLAYVAAEEA